MTDDRTRLGHGADEPVALADTVAPPATPASPHGLPTVQREHYAMGDELARGGMGRILLADDARLGRKVAIKEMLPGQPPDLLARFEREARITARLQHPSIVSIHEAGSWPSGEPFYVMKLVKGTPLDKVIDRAPDIARRVALIPNVIAVVDALAYAHHERVIHRDLKPANVLVGDYGETVVIDWGLAKDLGADSATTVPAAKTTAISGSHAHATVAGAVMGTPAYMSPEQANGDQVDERTDVYALGALLYHTLAGRPPYEGANANVILAQVVTDPPRPLADAAPGAPVELIAIVDKAMARSPASRYRTAGELAAELKSFQSGQLVGAHRYTTGQLVRRWVRKHRTKLGIAAASVIALVVAGGIGLWSVLSERARTEEQRNEAVVGRRDAESLVDFILTDLGASLRASGKLKLLEKILARTEAYYAGRVAAMGNTEHVNLARVYSLNFDVRRFEGRVDDARKAAEKAERICTELGALADRDATLCRTRALRDIALLDAMAGQHQAAVERASAAYETDNRLLASFPDDAETIRAVLDDVSRLGLLRNTTSTVIDAEALYRRALSLGVHLTELAPTSANFAIVATLHERLGDVLGEHGERTQRRAEYEASLAGFDEVLRRHPDESLWLHFRSEALGRLAASAMDMNDLKTAAEMRRRGGDDLYRLYLVDPTNTLAAQSLVEHDASAVLLFVQRGDLPQARVALARAVSMSDGVFQTSQDPLLRGARAATMTAMAEVSLASNEPAQALVQATEAVEIARPATARNLIDPDPRAILLTSLDVLARAKLATGHRNDAIALLREQIEIGRAAIARIPTDSEAVIELARAQADLGRTLGSSEGELLLRESLALCDSVHDKRAYERVDASASEALAKLLAARGQREEAAVLRRRALQMHQRLVAADPTNPLELQAVQQLRQP